MKIVVTAIVFATVFGFGGYYLGKQSTNTTYTNTKIQTSSLKDWKTYTNTQFHYSFNYPADWGVGKPCKNEERIGFIGIGPELLDSPSTDCGTANIPPTVYFYNSSSSPEPSPEYKIVEQKTISINNKTGQYLSLAKAGFNQVGSNNYLQFSLPLSNSTYLIIQTGAYEWPNLKNDFQTIISTLKFDTK